MLYALNDLLASFVFIDCIIVWKCMLKCVLRVRIKIYIYNAQHRPEYQTTHTSNQSPLTSPPYHPHFTTERPRRQSMHCCRNRSKLRPILKEASKHTQYERCISLKYDQLCFQGKSYSTSNLHSLPSNIHPRTLSEKRTNVLEEYLASIMNSVTSTNVTLIIRM